MQRKMRHFLHISLQHRTQIQHKDRTQETDDCCHLMQVKSSLKMDIIIEKLKIENVQKWHFLASASRLLSARDERGAGEEPFYRAWH